MKGKFKSLFFLVAATTSNPLSLICSCSNQNSLFITTENYSFLTSERSIVIPINFRESPQCDVYVEIDGVPQNTISLRQNVFNVWNQTLDLYIDLDDRIVEDSYINFNLTFYINRVIDQKQTFQLCNFVYYYQEHDPMDDDIISVTDKTCQTINDHSFTYELFFLEMPTSTNVRVEILDDSSKKLTLEQNEFPVVSEFEKIKATIKINLDLSIYQTRSFNFNLKFSFVNSKGRDQQTTFYGFVAAFEKQRVNEVPMEYFDIEEKNDEYFLNGFKPNVNPNDLPSYNTLVIPENVTIIKESAFSDPNLVPNIKEIILPNSVQRIDEYAFYGCHQLYELDLCSYETVPEWIDFNPNLIFDSHQMKYQFGSVWIKNDIPTIISQLWERGIPETWKSFSEDKTTQIDFFNISKDGTTLSGIASEAEALLPNIKVIRIPKHIKTIAENAFDKIKNVPYQGPDGPETRLLFLNNELESLSSNLFQRAGISGPLFFTSPYLSSIPKCAFQECNVYSDPLLFDVKEDSHKSITFIGCNNLVTIGDFAFSMFGCGGDELPLPQNIENIGDFAFQGMSYQKIKIPHTLNSVGKFAFADTITAEPSLSTSVIDFSDFHYKIHQEKPFYTPEWMTTEDLYIFLNTCSTSGKLILTTSIKSDFVEHESDLSKWESKFKATLSIPHGWDIEYVEEDN